MNSVGEKQSRAITIIIVNYRTPGHVVECLRSLELEAAAHAGVHVVIVDNASGDGSVRVIQEAIDAGGWQLWTTLIQSPHNGGFSAGNNIAIRRCRSEHYLLLNPDTVVKPGAITALLGFMKDHPRAGIVGSQLEDAQGVLQSSARRCLSPLTELEAGARTAIFSRWLGRERPVQPTDEPMTCDWVSGAAMCVRREVFDEVGLLDEGYFLYFEELDFCERAREGGWEVWALPHSRIVHLEGASTGIGDRTRRRPVYWYDSRRRFFLKRHGIAGLICADALWGLGRLSYAIRRRLSRTTETASAGPAAGRLFWGDLCALVTGNAFRIARGG